MRQLPLSGRIRPALSARQTAFLTAVLVVAADQATKAWAVAVLSDGPIRVIGDFLRLRLTRNPGAAFSILQGSGAFIALLAMGTAVVIWVVLRDVNRRIESIGLGLVLGGAVGNLVDRIARGDGLLDGAVVDFVDFDFFPTFNVADSAITIGVGLVLLGALLVSR